MVSVSVSVYRIAECAIAHVRVCVTGRYMIQNKERDGITPESECECASNGDLDLDLRVSLCTLISDSTSDPPPPGAHTAHMRMRETPDPACAKKHTRTGECVISMWHVHPAVSIREPAYSEKRAGPIVAAYPFSQAPP